MKRISARLCLSVCVILADLSKAAFTSESAGHRRRRSSLLVTSSDNTISTKKGKLLVMGGTGAEEKSIFLWQRNVYGPVAPSFLSSNAMLKSFFCVFTGFLGQAVCKRAALDGYQVTSLSRRGRPPSSGDQSSSPSTNNIKYLAGDAREKSAIMDVLSEGGYAGVLLPYRELIFLNGLFLF